MKKIKLVILSVLCTMLLIIPFSKPIHAESNAPESNDPETIIKSYNNAGVLDTSKINESVTVEGKTYYLLKDPVNYFAVKDAKGNVENYFNLDNKVYKQNAVGEIDFVGSVIPDETIILSDIMSLTPSATDNWNPTATYKRTIDLTAEKIIIDTVFAILSAITQGLASISVTAVSLITSWHNESPSGRRYVYVKYNQVSWVGCPIFIKTWNVYNYANSNYTGLISSDTTVRKTWTNHPMLNQYRVACAVPASMYW